MSAAKYAGLYALTLVVFLGVDMVWLGIAARGFYQRHLGALMAETVNWPVAIAFYLLYVAGVLVLVVIPAYETGSLGQALWRGALLGVVAYATYDLTNWSTLKGWPAQLAVVDITWGGVLTAITAFGGYHIARWLGR